ncbi:MAG: GAF domain-containing protein [Cyclobacteriaceae bacterium]
MSIFKRLLYAGIDHEMPEYLRRKVFPTNVVTLILMFLIAIPFAIISLFYFPFMAIFPSLGALVAIGVLAMNFNGAIYFSRVIISIMPITLAATYQAYLSNPGEEPIASAYLAELSFILVPFVIFDLREKGFLIFCAAYGMLLIITYPITVSWLNIDADSAVLRTGWLSTVTIILAILCEIGCVLGLALLNREAENRSEALIEDMDKKNAVLTSSEEKLLENLKKMEDVQSNEKKHSWITQGVGELSEILRSNIDQTTMNDKIITHVVKYLQANQGAFYIVERQDKFNSDVKIKLMSCYAYDRKKFVEQEIEPGDGILGQSYMEGSYIYLTEVPENYTRITSGLGESTPSALIVMPLKTNDSIEGMMEIASFHTLENHHIEFLNRAGENIASYIHNSRINTQTKQLLDETMKQAEVMRSQEEEMRQNMEELAATQEEMQRKEQEYLKKIDALSSALQAKKQDVVS